MINKYLIRFILLSLLFLFMLGDSLFAYTQRWKLRRYEIGGGFGMTQVFGDIGGTAEQNNWFGLKDIQFDETSMAFDLLVRYKIDPVYSVKANVILGFGHGDDADSKNPDRNGSYKTKLFEFSVQGEYYFLGEEKRYRSAAIFDRRGMLNNYSTISAYGFIGLGMVYSMADAIIDTEVPRPYDKFKRNNMGAVAPIGLGLKYIIDDRWLVNAELGYRISFTDYIDGYSQTRDSKHKDIYYFLTISLTYRLNTSRRGLPAFMDKEYKMINR